MKVLAEYPLSWPFPGCFVSLGRVATHNQTSQPNDFDYCIQIVGETRTRLISAASVVRLHSPPPNFPLKSSWCLSNFASSRTIPNLASCDISGPFAAIESPPESPPRFSTACLIRSTTVRIYLVVVARLVCLINPIATLASSDLAAISVQK